MLAYSSTVNPSMRRRRWSNGGWRLAGVSAIVHRLWILSVWTCHLRSLSFAQEGKTDYAIVPLSEFFVKAKCPLS